jgi:hypothetical protein
MSPAAGGLKAGERGLKEQKIGLRKQVASLDQLNPAPPAYPFLLRWLPLKLLS